MERGRKENVQQRIESEVVSSVPRFRGILIGRLSLPTLLHLCSAWPCDSEQHVLCSRHNIKSCSLLESRPSLQQLQPSAYLFATVVSQDPSSTRLINNPHSNFVKMSSSARGRAGKFKTKRGGGRNFSKNLRPLDADGGEQGMWGEGQDKKKDEDSEEEDSDDESDDDEAPKQGGQQEMTREERRKAAKDKKEAAIKKKKGTVAPGDLPSSESEEEEDEADMPNNPNHSTAARKQVQAPKSADPADAPQKKIIKKTDDPSQLSRREREALQAQQAKERYQKAHAELKTDEARADMERLKLVREERASAAARKDAEKAEKDLHEKEKTDQMARLERQQALKAARGGRGGKKGGKA